MTAEDQAPRPAKGPPERAPLEGRSLRLEPIDPARHVADLFAVSADDPALWTYMPYGPFEDPAQMEAWLEACARSDDPLFMALVETADARAAGMASFLNIRPAHGVLELGHIWFSQRLRQRRPATEAIFLMLSAAFDDLGYRRVEWKCDAANAASRRAALRFGFVYEGIFRQHLIVKGRNRDTAWFAILDRDWPALRSGFEAWLDPANFDDSGRQRRALSALTSDQGR
ncbi:MAG: GNAT family protein [Kiloniellales bacterium]|nr:GNAT family protein [Kiloniellales bacterium]